MATNLTGTTIATTYEKLVKRQDTYSSTGNRIEIQNDSAASLDTALYLDAVNQRVGIGTAAPIGPLTIASGTADFNLTIKHSSGFLSIIPHNDNDDAECDLRIGDLFFDASDSKFGINISTPSATLHIDQSSASGAIPVLKLDQADVDDTFIDFIGSSEADGSASISSDTTTDSSKYGAIRIMINGNTKWIRIYDDHS